MEKSNEMIRKQGEDYTDYICDLPKFILSRYERAAKFSDGEVIDRVITISLNDVMALESDIADAINAVIPKWIPVDPRAKENPLPRKGDHVLVKESDGDVPKVCEFKIEKNKDYTYEYFEDDLGEVVPLYWMPLPEEPCEINTCIVKGKVILR